MEQNNELQHWGVPGMKWGVRRNKPTSGNSKSKPKRHMSQDAKEFKELKKKKTSELTNAELRKLNERRNLERNYKNLNPAAVAKGIAIVGTTAAVLGNINSIKDNGAKLIKSGKSVVDSILKR